MRKRYETSQGAQNSLVGLNRARLPFQSRRQSILRQFIVLMSWILRYIATVFRCHLQSLIDRFLWQDPRPNQKIPGDKSEVLLTASRAISGALQEGLRQGVGSIFRQR